MNAHSLDSGICMKGNGDAFARALDEALADMGDDDSFQYLEIGLGHGQTFRAVRDYVRGSEVGEYSLNGVDVPSFEDTESYEQLINSEGWIHLIGSESYLSRRRYPLHFIFIDGCHCYDCAKADFLGAEKLIAPGGVIALHDCGIPEQGMEPQYGHGPIGVRKACEDLGLIPCTRPGWKLLEETNPYSVGGRACLFLQKL